MSLVAERYPDFGPTFTAEKLEVYRSIKISDSVATAVAKYFIYDTPRSGAGSACTRG